MRFLRGSALHAPGPPDALRRWVVFNHAAPLMSSTVVVAVDVGKTTVALSVTDAGRHRLLGPLDFPMTAPGLAVTVKRVCEVLPAAATGPGAVKVGIEAAGHYHRPLLAPTAWPPGWEAEGQD